MGMGGEDGYGGLEAGPAPEGASSSGSLERFRLLVFDKPRFADDMLGRRGELGLRELVKKKGGRSSGRCVFTS